MRSRARSRRCSAIRMKRPVFGRPAAGALRCSPGMRRRLTRPPSIARRSAVRRFAFSVILALLALGAAAPPTPVVVDGNALALSSLATIKGKEYVTLRSIGAALGAHVAYDPKRKQATITTEFREAMLVIGKPVALVNGERRALDAPPLVVGGRVMMPLRATAIAMGASVGYDRASHSVIVSTRGVN